MKHAGKYLIAEEVKKLQGKKDARIPLKLVTRAVKKVCVQKEK